MSNLAWRLRLMDVHLLRASRELPYLTQRLQKAHIFVFSILHLMLQFGQARALRFIVTTEQEEVQTQAPKSVCTCSRLLSTHSTECPQHEQSCARRKFSITWQEARKLGSLRHQATDYTRPFVLRIINHEWEKRP